MSAPHIFLANPPAPCPERWRLAFPSGQRLDAAAAPARLHTPDMASAVVWLSAADPGWPEQLHALLQVRPGARAVLLSNDPNPVEGIRALNAGACGYTHAFAVPALLQEVALVVEHGGLWVGPDLLQRLVASSSTALARQADPQPQAVSSNGRADETDPAADRLEDPWSVLSLREAEVARAVMAGRSNKEVAALMSISERTVKAHLGMVFERLGVRDRLQLVLRLSGSPERVAAPETEVMP